MKSVFTMMVVGLAVGLLFLFAVKTGNDELVARVLVSGGMVVLYLLINTLPLRNAGKSFNLIDFFKTLLDLLRRYGAYGYYLTRGTFLLGVVSFVGMVVSGLTAETGPLSMHLFSLGLLAMTLPLLLAFSIRWLRRFKTVHSFAFFFSYVITEDSLILAFCRSVPIFRVPLKEIHAVDRWRMLGAYAFASNDDALMMLAEANIWFWPRPILLDLRKRFTLRAENYEWTISLKTGYSIVIAAPPAFFRQIMTAMKEQEASNVRCPLKPGRAWVGTPP